MNIVEMSVKELSLALKEKKLSEVEVDKLVKKLSGHLKLERHLNAEELDLLYEESYK